DANGGPSRAALVPGRPRGAENPLVHVLARSAPGACPTLRGLARGWTARGLTATQRRPILASPRERSARGVPRSHCLPSWEHPRVSPLALPALAEAEEGAPPWRGGVGRGDERGTEGAYGNTPTFSPMGCRAARRRGGADRLHL